MYWPPFTSRLAPMIKPEAGDAKKTTAFATSCGRPKRPIGIVEIIVFNTLSRMGLSITHH
ncbi:hypothetical protein FOLKNPGA_02474 [Legionella sp. PC1000]|nr:hypothetical protein FOLKNPGA_02474 [Legionella sp. PC1000]